MCVTKPGEVIGILLQQVLFYTLGLFLNCELPQLVNVCYYREAQPPLHNVSVRRYCETDPKPHQHSAMCSQKLE